MNTDFALSIGVDTAPALAGLDALQQRIVSVAASYDSLLASLKSTMAAASTSTQQATAATAGLGAAGIESINKLNSSIITLNANLTRLSQSGIDQTMQRTATAAKVSTSAIEAQNIALARMDAQLGLISRSDLAYAQIQAQLNKLRQQGTIDQDQYNTRIDKANQLHDEGALAAGKMAHGMAGITREIIVIGHEALTGNFSRIPGSLLVLTSRLGGLTLSGLAAGAGFVALGAAMAYPIAHAIQLEAENRRLDASLVATGNTARVTAQQLRDMANVVASHSLSSRADALTAASTIASNNTVAPNVNIQSLTQAAADFAQVTGQEVPAATDRLIKALEGSYKGILQLNDAFPSLSQAELKNIKEMIDHGDVAGAMKLAVEGMGRGFHEAAAGGVGELSQAFHQLGQSFETLMDSISRNENFMAFLRQSARNLSDLGLATAALLESGPNHTARTKYALSQGNTSSSVPDDGAWKDLLHPASKFGDVPGPKPAPPVTAATPGAQANDDLTATAKMQAVALGQVGIAADLAQAHIANLARVESDASGKLKIANLDEASRIEITARYGQAAQLQVTNLELQAEAQGRLTNAVGLGWEATAKAEVANLVASEQAKGQLPDVQKLTDAYMGAAAAKAAFAGADYVAKLNEELTAATNLANAHKLGGEAITDATIANQLNAQSLKGLEPKQRALAESILYTIEARKEEAQAGDMMNKLKDEATVLQFQLGILSKSKEIRADQVQLLTQELALRRQFPNLDKGEFDELVNKIRANEQIKEQLDEQVAKQKELAQVAKTVSNDIARIVDQDIYNVLSGKQTNLWHDFKDLGLHAVADIAAQMLKTQFIMPVVTDVVGAVGGSSGTAGAQGGQGGLQQGLSLVNTANSISGYFGGPTLAEGASAAGTYLFGTAGGSMAGVNGIGVGAGAISDAAVSAGATQGTSLVSASGAIGEGGVAANFGGLSAGFGPAAIGGSLVGYGVGQMTHSPGISAAAGAVGGALSAMAVGAMMGSVVPVFGTIAGAIVGAVVGALSGQHITVGPNSGANSTFVNGVMGVGTSGQDNGGNAKDAIGLLQASESAYSKIVGAIGGTITDLPATQMGVYKGQYFTSLKGGATADDAKFFKDANAAVLDFVMRGLKSGAVTGLSADVQTALGKVTDTMSVDDVAQVLAFAATFKDSLAAMKGGVEDFAKADQVAADQVAIGLVKQINDFRDMTVKAGQSLDDANPALKSWVDAMFEAPKAIDAHQQQVDALTAKFNSMTPVLLAVGYSADEAAAKIDAGLKIALAQLGTAMADIGGTFALAGKNWYGTISQALAGITGTTTGPAFATIGASLKGLDAANLIDVLAEFGQGTGTWAGTIKTLVENQLKAVVATQQQQTALQAATASLGYFTNQLTGLAAFSGQLNTGNLSPLSPSAQLSAAQTAYTADFAAAKTGDQAAGGRYQNDATALLTAGRSFYGSAPAYSDPTTGLFAKVQADIASLQGIATTQVASQQTAATTLQSQVSGVTDALAGLTPALKAEVQNILTSVSSVTATAAPIGLTEAQIATLTSDIIASPVGLTSAQAAALIGTVVGSDVALTSVQISNLVSTISGATVGLTSTQVNELVGGVAGVNIALTTTQIAEITSGVTSSPIILTTAQVATLTSGIASTNIALTTLQVAELTSAIGKSPIALTTAQVATLTSAIGSTSIALTSVQIAELTAGVTSAPYQLTTAQIATLTSNITSSPIALTSSQISNLVGSLSDNSVAGIKAADWSGFVTALTGIVKGATPATPADGGIIGPDGNTQYTAVTANQWGGIVESVSEGKTPDLAGFDMSNSYTAKRINSAIGEGNMFRFISAHAGQTYGWNDDTAAKYVALMTSFSLMDSTAIANWATYPGDGADVKPPGFAGGGMVFGAAGVDSIYARLTNGEHVTQATSVTPQTLPILNHINRTGSLPSNDNGSTPVLQNTYALHRQGYASLLTAFDRLSRQHDEALAELRAMRQGQTSANHQRALA